MPILSAENNFKKGLAAFVDDNHVEAAMYFRRAMDIERQRHSHRPEMRYLSYYGLCLAKTARKTPQAIHACKTAVSREPHNPDLFVNLGKVYKVARQWSRARETFELGLSRHPGHGALLRELGELGDRRRSTGSARGWLGRLRAAIGATGASRRKQVFTSH
jgi:tetratricopeptide (TPR) repeat protein